MSTEWQNAKLERRSLVGNVCEVCGRPETPTNHLIGHHVLGKKLMKEYSLEIAELCRLRHFRCETETHQTFPGGNLPIDQELVRKIIASLKNPR